MCKGPMDKDNVTGIVFVECGLNGAGESNRGKIGTTLTEQQSK